MFQLKTFFIFSSFKEIKLETHFRSQISAVLKTHRKAQAQIPQPKSLYFKSASANSATKIFLAWNASANSPTKNFKLKAQLQIP